MKKIWLITFRSVTFAQKAQGLLRRELIETTLQRTPAGLSERGCSYCLGLGERDVAAAMALLRQKNLLTGKVFAKNDAGQWEEQTP